MATFWPSTNPASFRPCANAVARSSELAAVVLRRNPTIGVAGCCARAASGHATAEPATTLMKSRRRIACPKAQDCARLRLITSGICDQRNGVQGSVCTAAFRAANVRFGSKADILMCRADVRFTPKSRHRRAQVACPLCAKSTYAMQQKMSYSISSLARCRNDSGIVSPIALAVVRLMTRSNLVGCPTGRSAGHCRAAME